MSTIDLDAIKRRAEAAKAAGCAAERHHLITRDVPELVREVERLRGEREWRDVATDPPDEGTRVECWAPGWSSVAQGVRLPWKWRTWFGAYRPLSLAPTVWRDLPTVPRAALARVPPPKGSD